MITDEQSIESIRARVVAWAEYDRLVKVSDAVDARTSADDERDIPERAAAVDAFDAQGDIAEALGPRVGHDEILFLLAKADRLEALEKAILSSAGDEAQREAAIAALTILNEPEFWSKSSRNLASTYLAQGKALADLRSAVLKAKDVLTFLAHEEDCGHVDCTDPEKCQDGTEGDERVCDDVGVPCSCGVLAAENLMKLARGEAATKEGG